MYRICVYIYMCVYIYIYIKDLGSSEEDVSVALLPAPLGVPHRLPPLATLHVEQLDA